MKQVEKEVVHACVDLFMACWSIERIAKLFDLHEATVEEAIRKNVVLALRR